MHHIEDYTPWYEDLVYLHMSPQTYCDLFWLDSYIHSSGVKWDMGLGSKGQCREKFRPQEFPKPYIQGLCVEMSLVEGDYRAGLRSVRKGHHFLPVA